MSHHRSKRLPFNMQQLRALETQAKELASQLRGEKQIEILEELEGKYSEISECLRWCFPEDQYMLEMDLERVIRGLNLIGALGPFFWMRGKTKQVFPLIDRLLLESEDLANLPKQTLASFYFAAGQVFYAATEYDSALAIYFRAFQAFVDLAQIDHAADVLNEMGRVFREKNNLEDARRFHHEALDLFENNDANQYGIALALSNLGVVLYREGNLEEAKIYHRKALRIREKIRDYLGTASSLGNLALISLKKKDYEEAKQFYEQSLQLRLKLGDMWGIAGSHLSLAKVEIKLKNYKQSLRYLSRCLDGFKAVGDRLGFAETYDALLVLLYKTANHSAFSVVLGIAEEQRKRISAPLDDHMKKERKKMVKKVKEDYSKFKSGQKVGRKMSEEEALLSITQSFQNLMHKISVPLHGHHPTPLRSSLNRTQDRSSSSSQERNKRGGKDEEDEHDRTSSLIETDRNSEKSKKKTKKGEDKSPKKKEKKKEVAKAKQEEKNGKKEKGEKTNREEKGEKSPKKKKSKK